MRLLSTLLFGLVLPLTSLAAKDNGIGSTPAQRYEINLVQATTVIKAAVKKAKSVVPQNVAVVNPDGHLIAFAHMDNSYKGSIDISKKKALTSVLLNGINSNDILKEAYSGGDLYAIQETNGGLVVFKGGLPLYDKKGHLLGAIGVSGGTVQQDFTVAKAGQAALPEVGSMTEDDEDFEIM